MLRQLPAPPCPLVKVFVPRPRFQSSGWPLVVPLPGYDPSTGERYRQLPELPPPGWFCWPPRPIQPQPGCYHPDAAASMATAALWNQVRLPPGGRAVLGDELNRTCVYHFYVPPPLLVCEDEKRAWALCDVLNQREVDPLLYIPFLGSEGILDPSEIPWRARYL